MQLNRPTLDDAVLSWLVKLGYETQSCIASKSSIEVVHRHDGCDVFEDDLIHDQKRYPVPVVGRR